MSNELKKPRSIKELQLEFQQLSFKAGTLQYEIYSKNKDLEAMNSTLRDLSLEYISAKELEDAEAKKSEVATPVATNSEGSNV